jgi:hypothetical protein
MERPFGIALRAMRSCLIVLMTALTAAPLAAQETPSQSPSQSVSPSPTPFPEAPFGLVWLTSSEEARRLGVDFDSHTRNQLGDSYVARYLPKDLPDMHYAVLSFGFDDRLIRVTAIGREYAQDADGNAILQRYEELGKVLRDKYGAGEEEKHIDPKYSDSRFTRGLIEKKNWVYSVYTPPDMRIELSIFTEVVRPRWRIIFEHLPGMQQLEKDLKETEKEAL